MFRCVVKDLYITDPTRETCPTADHADYAAPARQHELDTSHRSGIYLSIYVSAVNGVGHQLGTDDL